MKKVYNKIKYKTTLIVIVALLQFLLLPVAENVAWAANVANVVDSIAITNDQGVLPDAFRPYDRIRIYVNWSIKSDVKAGDTFSFNLPKELRGFNGTIYLKDSSGNNFGTGVGSGEVINFTFSDLVEKYKNISGYFYIESQISHMEQQGVKEVSLVFQVINGTAIQVTIPVDTGGEATTSPGEITEVFEKWGSIDPDDENIIDWAIRINYKGDYLYNTTITDVVNEGHEFVQGSFSLYKGYTNHQTGEIENQSLVPLEYPINFTSSSKGYKLDLYIQGESYVAYYQTRVTDSTKAEFTNTAKLESWNKEPIAKEVVVQSFTSGGGASGDLNSYNGKLKLIKQDENDSNILLPNAKFELINDKDMLVATLVTDENGQAITPDIPGGIYTLKEIEAPQGYEITSEYETITLDFKVNKEILKVITNKKVISPTETPVTPPTETPVTPPAETPSIGTPEGEKTYEINVEIPSGGVDPSAKNVQNRKLPKTGETGKLEFYLTGLLFMVVGLYLKRRK